jgi:hypothetical protein
LQDDARYLMINQRILLMSETVKVKAEQSDRFEHMIRAN